MSKIQVASRYAKSLMDLAIERGVLEDVKKDIDQILATAASNRDFFLLLKSPIVSSDKKLNVLNALFSGSGHEIILRFFEIVTRKNRADVLHETALEFVKQYNQNQGIQVAEVTTAFELTPDLKAQFKEIIQEISGLEKVELVEKIDSEIIGGFVLKVNDRRMDESISGKLNEIKLQFAKRHFEKLY